MTIKAHVITHSVSEAGVHLLSLQLRYPRFIHAELMTHRVFSRNASSSRAIPVEKLITDVISDPVTPSYWGKNQPGMQAAEELTGGERARAEDCWARSRDVAIINAREMAAVGAHKQIVNRMLEPFSHINVIVTSTEWQNFFELRCHKDAMPEIRLLAETMRHAIQTSEPKLRRDWEWHLPYADADGSGDAVKVSVARCARVSYMTHEGKIPTVEDDLKLYDRLVGSRPLHASPAEHQALPDPYNHYPDQHGNLTGWRQYRKMLING